MFGGKVSKASSRSNFDMPEIGDLDEIVDAKGAARRPEQYHERVPERNGDQAGNAQRADQQHDACVCV